MKKMKKGKAKRKRPFQGIKVFIKHLQGGARIGQWLPLLPLL